MGPAPPIAPPGASCGPWRPLWQRSGTSPRPRFQNLSIAGWDCVPAFWDRGWLENRPAGWWSGGPPSSHASAANPGTPACSNGRPRLASPTGRLNRPTRLAPALPTLRPLDARSPACPLARSTRPVRRLARPLARPPRFRSKSRDTGMLEWDTGHSAALATGVHRSRRAPQTNRSTRLPLTLTLRQGRPRPATKRRCRSHGRQAPQPPGLSRQAPLSPPSAQPPAHVPGRHPPPTPQPARPTPSASTGWRRSSSSTTLTLPLWRCGRLPAEVR